MLEIMQKKGIGARGVEVRGRKKRYLKALRGDEMKSTSVTVAFKSRLEVQLVLIASPLNFGRDDFENLY